MGTCHNDREPYDYIRQSINLYQLGVQTLVGDESRFIELEYLEKTLRRTPLLTKIGTQILTSYDRIHRRYYVDEFDTNSVLRMVLDDDQIDLDFKLDMIHSAFREPRLLTRRAVDYTIANEWYSTEAKIALFHDLNIKNIPYFSLEEGSQSIWETMNNKAIESALDFDGIVNFPS